MCVAVTQARDHFDFKHVLQTGAGGIRNLSPINHVGAAK